MVGVAGNPVMVLSVGAVTVSVLKPLIAPEVAVIVVVPGERAVQTPWLSTEATAGLLEVQLTKV